MSFTWNTNKWGLILLKDRISQRNILKGRNNRCHDCSKEGRLLPVHSYLNKQKKLVVLSWIEWLRFDRLNHRDEGKTMTSYNFHEQLNV